MLSFDAGFSKHIGPLRIKLDAGHGRGLAPAASQTYTHKTAERCPCSRRVVFTRSQTSS